MTKYFMLLIVFIVSFSCKNEQKSDFQPIKKANKTTKTSETKKNFGIVIHGGAGTILKENMRDSLEEAYRQKLKQAITEGHSILKNGGTSMQAVTKTITIRQSPQYF